MITGAGAAAEAGVGAVAWAVVAGGAAWCVLATGGGAGREAAVEAGREDEVDERPDFLPAIDTKILKIYINIRDILQCKRMETERIVEEKKPLKQNICVSIVTILQQFIDAP
jgi:hypothetical protein